MPEHADTLITHGYLFTMQGDGVGYVPDGAVAVQGAEIIRPRGPHAANVDRRARDATTVSITSRTAARRRCPERAAARRP